MRRFIPRISIFVCLFLLASSFVVVFPVNAQDAGQQGEADVTTTPPLTTTGALPPGVTNETFYTGSNVPYIYPRNVWEGYEYSTTTGWQAGNSLRNLLTWFPQPDNQPPDYAPVERIVVHDQGCLNPTTCITNAEQYPVQTIQNIYRSHAVTRGWGDIGYNYIIDRQGRTFEGRYGGNGVRGAHIYVDARCENINVGTAGVLLLGDLRGSPMTSAQSESLSRLAGWLGATNGMDMSQTSATTTTWKNPTKSGGGCDLSSGGYTGSLTAARLISHGDIEPGNSDFFSLTMERVNATTQQTAFTQLFYQDEGLSTVYAIRDGALHDSTASTPPTQIAQTQLEHFPRATFAALPDGSLVKSRTRARVFVIEAGKRRSIPTADLFELKGYQWTAIQEASDRELSLMKLGDPLPYPNDTLVKGNGEEVYVFENATLHHVSSASLFETLRFTWTSIKKLFDDDIALYQKGEPKFFPDGTLVKGSAPRVWKLEQGKRKAVLSASLFEALGFKWTEIKVLDSTELTRYAESSAYTWPEGTLLRAEGDERVYLMHGGFRRWIQTAEAFLALGYRWQAIHIVSSEEILAAPEAQPIANANDRNLIPQPIVVTPPPAPPAQPVTDNSQPVTTVGTEPMMRVGLSVIGADKHTGNLVGISYDSGATVKQNGAVLTTLTPGQQYSFAPSVNDIWRIEPSTASGIATVSTYTDLAYNGSNDNRFRGVIEIKAATPSINSGQANGTLWLINELPMEQYLRGIAETINGDPPEYGKAFVIAARSYALYHYQGGGKRIGEPFVIRRTSADQLYKGYNFELRATDPVAAVNATRGMVATFNSKPILAAYSSGAPGPTKSACEALSSAFCNNPDFAYLNGGVDDPSGIPLCPNKTPQGVCYQYSSSSGANHGAGLDATGARQMAALGSTAAQILATYYPGTTIATQW